MKTRRRYYGKDRISGLPDCLLLHILSNLKMSQAVEISILSTRWKDLWKHMTDIFLHFRNFESIKSFASFVSQFFSFRNDETSLQALTFECRNHFDPEQLKRILKYLFSHKIQRLDMTVVCSLEQFPLCTNFSYGTLTSLKLFACEEWKRWLGPPAVFPNSLKLPALTYLFLRNFTLRSTTGDGNAEPFSVFQSLNTLIIRNCQLYKDKDNLFISSLSLVNLTISFYMRYRSYYNLKLSTPNLSSFDISGSPFQNLSAHNTLSSIKHVRIDLLLCPTTLPKFSSILFDWLAQLALVESLTISSTTLQIHFPYLHNLKLLKIETQRELPQPDGTEDFFLQNSPSAKKVIFLRRTMKGFIYE
ncbi:unnamed protein product [Vicia faba]|uniref:F-box domain-containing protein n=1 Tax=Vicia faba TaxID=3906 RepID=A0AAV0YLE0_VICFA|nr:unnamed protein product [Vicia faba]